MSCLALFTGDRAELDKALFVKRSSSVKDNSPQALLQELAMLYPTASDSVQLYYKAQTDRPNGCARVPFESANAKVSFWCLNSAVPDFQVQPIMQAKAICTTHCLCNSISLLRQHTIMQYHRVILQGGFAASPLQLLIVLVDNPIVGFA